MVRVRPGLTMLREAGVRLLHLIEREFAPKRCVFCNVITEAPERFVCAGCDSDLPRIGAACPRCALPVPVELPPGVACAECQTAPPPWSSALAPLEYAFPVDAAIKAMKFRRRLDYLPAFDDELARLEIPDDIDAVVPVPLHRWRQLRRGFNQAEELARPIARRLGLPLSNAVSRVVGTESQSGLDAAARRRNLRAAFRARKILPGDHALVVDDVITTGETLKGVARVLLDSGVRKVSVIALARSV